MSHHFIALNDMHKQNVNNVTIYICYRLKLNSVKFFLTYVGSQFPLSPNPNSLLHCRARRQQKIENQPR